MLCISDVVEILIIFFMYLVSLDRGRQMIEQQEMDTIKRIYHLRQTLANESRKQNKT